MVRLSPLALAAAFVTQGVRGAGLPALDVEDADNIKQIAKLVAEDLFSFYPINEIGGWTVGILPGPPPDGDYYWWQGGAMWGTYVDYWRHTEDDSYNGYITDALLHQAGDNWDYMPANWSASMGNDDQAFWALSALLAAEEVYPNPPKDGPQWLALAQAVFNEQTSMDRRVPVDGGNCAWGLRWQVFPSNQGYDYINTIGNACFFNIGSRLYRYTGNDTFFDWANKTYEFVERLGYVTPEYNVYDGGHLPKECKDINTAEFSYNTALLLQGCAFLYDKTGDAIWKTRLDGLVDAALKNFFPNGVAFEKSCEPGGCNTDMISYKGYLHRWMASAMQLAPHLQEKVLPVLKTSAQAAVAQCTGGTNGRMCGFHWSTREFDGVVGAGQEMNVLSALLSIMTHNIPKPVTLDSGGTSKGDNNAGSDTSSTVITYAPVTTADKAGAGILTALILAGASSTFAWMSID